MRRLGVLVLAMLGAIVLSYFLWLEKSRRPPEAPLGHLEDLSSLPAPASEEAWEGEGAKVRTYADGKDEFRVYADADGRILGMQARFLSHGFAGPSTRLGKLADARWDREVQDSDRHSRSQKPEGAEGKAAFYERVANEGLGLRGSRTDTETEENGVDRVQLEIRVKDCPPMPKWEAEED